MEDILINDEDYILKARDHIECWEFISAKRVLEQLLDINPENAEGFYLLGELYFRQLDRYDVAAGYLKDAMRLAPTYHAPYMSYLELLCFLGRAVEVLDLAPTILCLSNVNIARIKIYEAEAHEILKDYDKALELYRRALLESKTNEQMNYIESCIERVLKKKALKYSLDMYRDYKLI